MSLLKKISNKSGLTVCGKLLGHMLLGSTGRFVKDATKYKEVLMLFETEELLYFPISQ